MAIASSEMSDIGILVDGLGRDARKCPYGGRPGDD